MKRFRWVLWFAVGLGFFILGAGVALSTPGLLGPRYAAAAMGFGTAATVCFARAGWFAGWRDFP